MFYWVVVQALLLFGGDTWVLLVPMSRKLEGVHVVFIRKMMGQKAKRQRDGAWRSEAAAKVLKEVCTQTLGGYI